jgi:hypothetical protein
MKSQHIKEVLYIAGIVHINLSKIRVKVKAARKKKKKNSPAECFSFFIVSFEPGGGLEAHHPLAGPVKNLI